LTLAKALAAIVGAENALDDSGSLAAYATDHKERGVPPLVAVLPATTAEVQAIVRLCAAQGVALIPRGAGTGTVGGAVPEAAAVVLDLSRMNRILAVDADNLLADVEAGVVTGDFQRAMEKQGLFYPPDPSSSDTSTLGGNAATNAGGLRAIKYGVTGDWIAGLQIVLADGQLIRAGTRTRKGVVGYDLTRLFVGSEGTLGVIVGLTLRLAPKPATKRTLLAVFADVRQAGEAVLAVLRGPVTPAAMELMDASALAAVRSKLPAPIPPGHATLLLDVDGDAESTAREAAALAEILAGTKMVALRRSASEEEAKALWAARRAISQALYEIRPQRAADDVAVPISALVELFEGVEQIAKKAGVQHACFGHAGDGNVHVNLLYDPADDDESARVKRAREEVFRLTLRLGGTLSGEHGVGVAKRAFVPWEQPAALIDLQKRLKRAFDPLDILNPGKVFP